MQSHGKKKKFRWRNYMADDLIGFLENFSALMEMTDSTIQDKVERTI